MVLFLSSPSYLDLGISLAQKDQTVHDGLRQDCQLFGESYKMEAPQMHLTITSEGLGR
ncbi:hypothetical protein SBDP1_220013 [Syntrophobacter sp. SbD1]|nr:hypothetical protein SBDP1_220013 [Syntrophobacter sp. SbD1]